MDEQAQPLEDRKVEKGVMRFSAVACLIAGIVIMFYFFSKVTQSHSVPKDGEVLNFEHWGAFGDFIAGVAGTLFSLGGFFLLYLTLQDQRENFHKERLESNFFELVRFHRENVEELLFTYQQSARDPEKVTAVRRKVFKMIVFHFKELWEELEHFFTNVQVKDIYQKAYLEQCRKNPRLVGRTIDLAQLARIDIVYHIIFFGLSEEDSHIISKRLGQKYAPTFIKAIISYASLKPKKESEHWLTWELINTFDNKVAVYQEILKKRANPGYEPKEGFPNWKGWYGEGDKYFPFFSYYPDNYFKYYGGHQFRLGHYYRHMYAAVNFIDRERYLTPDEKYFYIKILRVQLSNYEQIALFLNTLSGLGRPWELEGASTLITTYNLITNIPSLYIMGDINIKNYYPNVQYEDELAD